MAGEDRQDSGGDGLRGRFTVGGCIENLADRGRGVAVPRFLVDTVSEYTRVPAATQERIGVEPEKKDVAFAMAKGTRITRCVGFAIVRVGGRFTVDEIVFAQKQDPVHPGARSLEGLNLAVDARRRKRVAAGPLRVARARLR